MAPPDSLVLDSFVDESFVESDVVLGPFVATFAPLGTGQKLAVWLNGERQSVTQLGAVGEDTGTHGFTVGNREDYPGFGWNGDSLLFWKRVPRTGTFIAATGDRRSRSLLRAFASSARAAAPGLDVVTFRSPFRGWLVPHTRLSDNASFWDEGYPALMITDTAFLRNPHYHRASDTSLTLDYEFMARVVDAVAETVREVATA